MFVESKNRTLPLQRCLTAYLKNNKKMQKYEMGIEILNEIYDNRSRRLRQVFTNVRARAILPSRRIVIHSRF